MRKIEQDLIAVIIALAIFVVIITGIIMFLPRRVNADTLSGESMTLFDKILGVNIGDTIKLEDIKTICSKYKLPDKDAYIIFSIRQVCLTVFDEQVVEGIKYPVIFLKTIQSNSLNSIEWACYHLSEIHKTYDVLPEQSDYITYIYDYFYKLGSKYYTLDKGNEEYLINYTKKYLSVNFPEVEV